MKTKVITQKPQHFKEQTLRIKDSAYKQTHGKNNLEGNNLPLFKKNKNNDGDPTHHGKTTGYK